MIINNMDIKCVPMPWYGPSTEIPFEEYQWLKNLHGKVFCRLFDQWPNRSENPDLPDAYDLYVVSFHLEPIDVEWIDTISSQTTKPIIVLGESFDGLYPFAENVHAKNYVYWHRQIEKAQSWFQLEDRPMKAPALKTSALCHRVTLSKAIIVVALLENMPNDCMVKLSTWIEHKNIDQKKLNVADLDGLIETFWHKYAGKEISIDNFEDIQNANQSYTMNPWVPYLQNVAIHFTNETFNYSLMHDGKREVILPGPFLTEKTLKCLLAGKSFIPVGQYNTYSSLKQLGLEFDYPFDITWDADPGNLSRLKSIVDLIKWFKNYTADEIHQMVSTSSQHNLDHVWSGNFSRRCHEINQRTIFGLLSQFG
jgi:hypothetical protein